MKLVAVSVAAAAIAVAAAGGIAQPAPTPAPSPFAIGTLQPFGTETAAPLPNIGRTRSVTPACSAMRDLIVPSFAAAQRADKTFVETRKRLPNYADIADDPSHQDDGYRQMLLSKLDADVSTLYQDAQVVSKALNDPRLDNKADPQVVAERRALQQLYDAQKIRANMINEFVSREHVATAKQGFDDNTAFTPRQNSNQVSIVSAPPIPTPQLTAAPGMPLRSGIQMADKNSLADWGTSIAVYVRQNENAAAKTFLPIAQSCR